MVVMGIIALITFFTFRGFFNFGICCDDTLAAYNALNSGISWKNIFSPYGGQVAGMGVMYKLFEFNSANYIWVLLILRLLAASSVYILALQLSQRKSVAFAASLLFSIGYAGINTAEYAHLNNIYLGIFFLCIGISLLFRYYKTHLSKLSFKSLSFFIVISLLFSISIAIATVRVSSVLIYFALLEFILFLLKRNSIKAFVVRASTIGIFIFILKNAGSFGGNSPYHLEMIKYGIRQSLSSLESTLQSLYYLVSIYFDILSPPALDKIFLQILHSLAFVELVKSKLYIIVFLLMGILAQVLTLRKDLSKNTFFIFQIFWLFFLIGFTYAFGDVVNNISTQSQTLGYTNYEFGIMNTLFSGYFIFIVVLVIYKLLIKKFKNLAFISSALLIWPISFMSVTFFFTPRTFAFDTFLSYFLGAQESYVHYYLVPSIGVYLLICYLALAVIQKFTSKVNFIFYGQVLIAILVIANILSIHSYINLRSPYRNKEILDSVSKRINQEISTSFWRGKRPIVYFSKSYIDPYFYPYVISEWGFAPNRYSLLNNRTDIIPFFSDKDFDSFYREVKTLPDISIYDIYAFEVVENGLQSKTIEVRQKLNKL